MLLVARYLGRGKSSGIELDVRIPSIHRLRAGMIVSVRDYSSREEALEAAGAAGVGGTAALREKQHCRFHAKAKLPSI